MIDMNYHKVNSVTCITQRNRNNKICGKNTWLDNCSTYNGLDVQPNGLTYYDYNMWPLVIYNVN